MKFDLSKCQKNEQGHYLCQNARGESVLVVAVLKDAIDPLVVACNKGTCAYRTDTNGYYVTGKPGHSLDLVNIPTEFEHERWVNVYSNGLVFHKTKNEAEVGCSPGRIACVRVVIKGKEGDGISNL